MATKRRNAKSRRTIGRQALERGLRYEAKEGARGGEAVRKMNCQRLGRSGGADVKAAALASSDCVATTSVKATGNSGSKSGDGIETRIWLVLYSDFSAEQHPVSP